MDVLTVAILIAFPQIILGYTDSLSTDNFAPPYLYAWKVMGWLLAANLTSFTFLQKLLP